jgi:hypothetical protein
LKFEPDRVFFPKSDFLLQFDYRESWTAGKPWVGRRNKVPEEVGRVVEYPARKPTLVTSDNVP